MTFLSSAYRKNGENEYPNRQKMDDIIEVKYTITKDNTSLAYFEEQIRWMKDMKMPVEFKLIYS